MTALSSVNSQAQSQVFSPTVRNGNKTYAISLSRKDSQGITHAVSLQHLDAAAKEKIAELISGLFQEHIGKAQEDRITAEPTHVNNRGFYFNTQCQSHDFRVKDNNLATNVSQLAPPDRPLTPDAVKAQHVWNALAHLLRSEQVTTTAATSLPDPLSSPPLASPPQTYPTSQGSSAPISSTPTAPESSSPMLNFSNLPTTSSPNIQPDAPLPLTHPSIAQTRLAAIRQLAQRICYEYYHASPTRAKSERDNCVDELINTLLDQQMYTKEMLELIWKRIPSSLLQSQYIPLQLTDVNRDLFVATLAQWLQLHK
ncbi:MAG TPA: hypothetical protein VGJ00_08125 [Rhabdochlamydiaceae bacterium]|jgi:hypothetical protein